MAHASFEIVVCEPWCWQLVLTDSPSVPRLQGKIELTKWTCQACIDLSDQPMAKHPLARACAVQLLRVSSFLFFREKERGPQPRAYVEPMHDLVG